MVPNPANRPRPLSLLVVEDETLLRVLIADELREVGFVVLEAASADEALSYVEAGVQFDAVFTDVQLPGSLSGLELGHRLRADRPDLPVVLTSGNHQNASECNVTLFFPKPYEIHEVVAFLVRLVASQNGDQG
jgi:two-component system, response regulator PdtaR